MLKMATSYVMSGLSKIFALIERNCTDEIEIVLLLKSERGGSELFLKEFLEMFTLSKL